MKRKILSICAVMILAISMVFAVPLDNKNELLKKELSAEIEKEVAKNGSYQNLTIDSTFNIENVSFEGEHTVYTTVDKNVKDFVFENKYVTSAKYNEDEIANIFYKIKNGQVQDVKVVLDKANEDKDVLLNIAIKQMPTIENKNEISLFVPNDRTAIAFTENTYKMFVVEDENGRYSDYVINEADGSVTIDRDEFFTLHQNNKIKNTGFSVETAVTLQIILILLFAILAILAFLSYILINKDKINKSTKEKNVEEKTATKRKTQPKVSSTRTKTTTQTKAKKQTTAKKTTKKEN